MKQACPLEQVDRRLADALRLWNAARHAYFDPDLFRTNAQSAIQALRSVTWILQKEKVKLAGFDAWYESKQNQMRADPVLRWLVDARNRIEKQGDLVTRSTVRTTIYLGWLGRRESEREMPPQYSSVMLARALAAALGKDKIEDGTVIRVERRWVDSELPNIEILDALSHAYEHLQALVFEAHGLLSDPLIGVCPFHAKIRTSNFVLPSEMLRPHARHQWLDAKSGKPLRIDYQERAVQTESAKEKVTQYYGPVFGTPEKPLESFRDRCEYFFSGAKVMLARDGYHHSTALLERGQQSQIVQFLPNSRAAKHAYMRDIADLAKRIGAESVILIGEMWTAKVPLEGVETIPHAVDVPNRGEALSLTGLDRRGECIEIAAHFTRVEGKIVFEAEERHEGGSPNFIIPFRVAFGLPELKPEPPIGPAGDGYHQAG